MTTEPSHSNETPRSMTFRDWLAAMLLLQPARMRKSVPFLCSLCVHAAIGLMLALWMLPLLTHGLESTTLDAAFSPKSASDSEQLETTFDVSAAEMSSQLAVVTTVSASVPQQPVAATAVAMPKPQLPRLLAPSVPTLSRMSDAQMTEEMPAMMSAMPMHRHRGQTRVEEAMDTGTIAASLRGDLLSIANDGDTVVVWMLDQSLSMQQDVQSLANRLIETLDEIGKDKKNKVDHYVVPFGDNIGNVAEATHLGRLTARRIFDLPPDLSGVENTFQAVEWCIDNCFNARRWLRSPPRQRLLVIWTDESGDDYLRLEHTIQRCLQANIRVDIIGPSSVLGAQSGFTAYRHPADGLTYFLPVHRGPDSSFPQKLALSYWYRGVPRTHDESFDGPFQGTSPAWHGGSNLEAMLCGFSPYALTRLARQTGGRYTIYDRPGDRPPFRLDDIRDYMPDYRSFAEIQFDLQRQPLRQLVLTSAAMTWESQHTKRIQPELVFRPTRGGESGSQFRQQTLPQRLSGPVSEAFKTACDVEQALTVFANAATAPSFQPGQAYLRDVPETSENSETSSAPRSQTSQNRSSDAATADGAEKDADTSNADLRAVETQINETLLEQLYRNEPSKRWRAWSDLNMGRLLAISVRLREYLTVTDALLRNVNELEPKTNFIQLSPADQLQGGAISVERAKLARMLLERCVEQNRGTPWAVMAERELQYPLGLQFSQRFIPEPPPPRPGLPAAPARQRPSLPNL